MIDALIDIRLRRGTFADSPEGMNTAQVQISDEVARWKAYRISVDNLSELEAAKSAADVLRVSQACGWSTVESWTSPGARAALMDWFTGERQAGRAVQTLKNVRSRLKAWGEWLSQRNPGIHNPMQGWKMPRVRACDRGPGMRAFSLAEVRALILQAEAMEAEHWQARRWAPNRSALYCFLAHTGLRIGEALRLRVCDVDTQARLLRVRSDKAGRGDWVPFHEEAAAAVSQLIRARGLGREDRLFRKVWHGTLCADMQAAGVPRRTENGAGLWHSFRKMNVTERLIAGVGLEDVRRLARHVDSRTTADHYARKSAEQLRRSAEILPRLNGFAVRELRTFEGDGPRKGVDSGGTSRLDEDADSVSDRLDHDSFTPQLRVPGPPPSAAPESAFRSTIDGTGTGCCGISGDTSDLDTSSPRGSNPLGVIRVAGAAIAALADLIEMLGRECSAEHHDERASDRKSE